MPEITLRAYSRDVDEMIEREKLEEAIAHCRHVLQTYPKHLETYRLLGKAYLEAKRYGDAADIFQRVLSAVPDDFVAHIGMSIVREDEGNLDAAIWHMERAFETNPSNPAIQQELKRLIGRRDGLEPHKVRLTRGALARMYAHGELFPQAIAELRSALQEDPDRPDLQVLLAEMFWRTDQHKEATSVANQVLEKLPYCLEANRILAANLQAKDRIEEAALYHRRLAGLDPYAAFVESAMADPGLIEESAVSVERFEWKPGAPMPDGGPAQPGWAATLGMEMKQSLQRDRQDQPELPQTGPLPSWLEPGEPPPFEAGGRAEEEDEQAGEDGLPGDGAESYEPEWLAEETAADVAAIDNDLDESEDDFMQELSEAGDIPPEPSEVRPDDAAEIPDWMQEAGWTEASGEAVEQPVSFSDTELRSLEAGELPAETPADEQQDAELTPAELPDWIQGIAPEPGAGEEIEEAADSGKPEWLAAGDDEEDVELTAADLAAQAGEPSFQAKLPTEDAQAEPEEPEPSFPAASAEDDDSRPSFPAADAGTEDLPTWITEDAPGATDTIVTWLGGQDRKREAGEQDGLDELPEWMKDTGPLVDKGDGGIGIPSTPTPAAESEPEEAAATEPDWMAGILDPEDEDEAMLERDFVREAATAEDLPETDQPAPASASKPTDESPDLPGWLSAVAEAAAAEEAAEPESPDEPPGEPGEPEFERPAGLPPELAEELVDEGAAAEGIDAEGDQLAPAEPPDWLSEAMGEPPSSMEAEEYSADSAELADVEPPSWMEAEQDEQADWLTSEQDAEPAGEPAGTPEWLSGLAEEGAPEPAGSRASEAPDWLREIAESDSQPAASDFEAELPAEEPETPTQAPATTEEGRSPVEEPATDQVSPAGEIGEAPPAVEEPEEMPRMAPGVTADMETPSRGTRPPDWLRATQSQDAQPQATDVPQPEQPAEPTGEAGVPAWLSSIGDSGEAAPESEAAPDSENAPDWLEDTGEADEGAREPVGAPDWLGDIGEETAAPAARGAAADWLGDIGEEPTSEAPAESAPDWLSGIGQEPAPPQRAAGPAEPEPSTDEEELVTGTPPADVDDDVISWLEDLAAAQEQTEVPQTIQQTPTTEAEAPVMEQREIPEEPEEGLEWLEQLAEKRGLDVDVSLPEAAATTQPRAPRPEPEPAPPSAEDSAPDWLTRMATQPLPKLDEQALEAARRQKPREQAEPEAPAIDPGAETIRKPADEFRAEAPPVEEQEPVTEDELPEWLRQAASQEPAPQDLISAAEPPPEPEAAQPAATPPPEPEAAEPAAMPPPEPEVAEPAAMPPPEPEAAEPAAMPPPEPEAAEPAAMPPPEPEVAEPAAMPPATPPLEPAPVEPTRGEHEPPAAEAPPHEAPAPGPPAEAREPEPAEEPAAPEPEPPAAAEPAPEPPAEAREPEPAEEPAAPEPEPPAAAEPAPEPPAEAQEPEPAEEPAAPEPEPEPAAAEPAEEPAAPEPEPEPAAAAEPATPPKADQTVQTLDRSREALASGDYEQAIELYGGLIKRKKSLEDVIEDLRMAVDRTPDNPALWQTLGDAYMKSDQSAEAIDAYRRGMEVA